MMLTREQAAESWCPMVRIARHEVTEQRQMVNAQSGMELVRQQDHIVGGCNTDALGRLRVPASCRCIADQCAMWRWGEFQEIAKPAVVDDPSFGTGGKRITTEPVRIPFRGYCGLAGHPAGAAA